MSKVKNAPRPASSTGFIKKALTFTAESLNLAIRQAKKNKSNPGNVSAHIRDLIFAEEERRKGLKQ